MREREKIHPESHNKRATDPITQRVQAVAENGDQVTMERINHLLRTDPYADMPGERPELVQSDRAAISTMISEGGPVIPGK